MSAELHSFGIRVGNLSGVDERFICSHCKLVLRDAVQGDCGHRFCKNCVHIKWKESQVSGAQSLCRSCDPDDEPATISPDRTYPDNAIRREMRKLKVRCPHESCEEKMPLKDLESHVTECPMRPQKCPACGQEVPHSLLPEHEVKDCPKRLVECDACGEKVAFNELDEHSSKFCIGSTKQCEFCGVRVKDDDESRDEHQRNECLVGWHQTKPCPYGCGMLEDWEKHRTECLAKHLDRMLGRVKEFEASDWRPAETTSTQQLQLQQQISDIQLQEQLQDIEEANASLIELNRLSKELEAEANQAKKELAKAEAAALSETPQEMLQLLAQVREMGKEVNELSKLLDDRKAKYKDLLIRYETEMQKETESLGDQFKEDLEKKKEDLLKLLAYKEMHITELELRANQLKFASYDGVFVWNLAGLANHRMQNRSLYSPPFFTGKPGYKMCGRLYLHGDGAGRGTHVSVYLVIMRNDFDALMPWPFVQRVTIEALRHRDRKFEGQSFDPSKLSDQKSSFDRPVAEMNRAAGFAKFKTIDEFFDESNGFVKADTAFIKFTVDITGLP